MSVGVLGARHQDKDGDRVSVLMKCNLDREDRVSLCPCVLLPYAWISGRDFCLVGVSCHIPSSGLACLCFSFHASCLNSFETWNGGCSNPSIKKESTRFNKNIFQWTQMAFKNVHHFWKMLETATRGDAHFCMTFWIVELTHIVFWIGANKYYK